MRRSFSAVAVFLVFSLALARVSDPPKPEHDDSFQVAGSVLSLENNHVLVAVAKIRGASPVLVKAINLETRKEIAELEYLESIYAVAYSPEGKYLATAESESIRLWDTKTWKEVVSFKNPSKAGVIPALAFSPDGKWLAFVVGSRRLYFWDVPGKKCVDLLYGPDQEIGALAWLSDGINAIAWLNKKELIVGTGRGTVVIWNTETKRSRHVFKEPKSQVSHVAVSPDGKLIAAANGHGRLIADPTEFCRPKDRMLHVWDAENCKEKATVTIWNCRSLQFSPDGKLVAVGIPGGVKLIDPESGKTLGVGRSATPGEGSSQSAFSPDGKKLYSAVYGEDGERRIRAHKVAKLLEGKKEK